MLYVLIDVTKPNYPVLSALSDDIQGISAMGRIAQASGRKVLAPPLERRAFSKFSKEQLENLYFSIVGNAPAEDMKYNDLCMWAFDAARKMEIETTSIETLEKEAERLCPGGYVPSKQNQKIEKPSRTEGEVIRPASKTSTTGLVWVIADEVTAKLGHIDRKAIIEACVSEAGINPATAATQFSRWKASKNPVQKV